MNWKLKARIQNLIAMLPSHLSYEVYYFIQRRFGNLAKIDPTSRLLAGINIINHIKQHGQSIDLKAFLEIGTGTNLSLPIALWLCGASQIMTLDLNPYLRAELAVEGISFLKHNSQVMQSLFGMYSRQPAFLERFNLLISGGTDLDRIFDITHIQYRAPADAAHLELQPGSIDYHISCAVLEHIPPTIVKQILLEAKRLLTQGGLFLHFVDFSDHFSHSDRSISAINFLQYNERDWEYYSGNRYMYHNRLRIDDFLSLFNEVGIKILSIDRNVDQRCLNLLRCGFPLAKQYKSKQPEVIATTNAWFVASLR